MTVQRSTSGLRLFTSNRLESLVKTLAKVLQKPLASPLAEEMIVVQSKGMERWVSMELARHHGVCANVRFPFPNAFVHEMFQRVFNDLHEPVFFDSGIITWKIMKWLPACVTRKAFGPLRNYFADSQDDLKRFQLCERIAASFDQYLTFRPEMILSWEDHGAEHWQAILWRELFKGKERSHAARLGKAFLDRLDNAPADIGRFPERVSVFGISALPRFHMQILAAVARFVEVNLFLMNPCKEYWGDIVSDWEMKKTLAKELGQEISVEDLHLEKGNSLLASMGRLGRDFFDLVNECAGDEMTFFEEPGEDSLLRCIQSDILNLRDRGRDGHPRKALSEENASIQIHSCHSPMREIEVLYDRLLDVFEKDSSLLPKDVLVMTPDIETYAPYIRAVFDTPADAGKRFPFSIADRDARQESEVIDTFLSILDLCGSRFGASLVLAVLESPAVRQRFGFSLTDLDAVRKWIAETGTRWGIGAETRAALGLPAFAENTWKAGLERLLLGYALPGHDEHLFAGVLPYDHIEGGEANVLGRLVEFADRLFEQVTALQKPRTLAAWSSALTELLDGFFMPDEDTQRDVQFMRRMLRNLAAAQNHSGYDKEVNLRVIRYHLQQCLEKEGFGFGFLTGGITFCAMLPMRSIPFKVIALVGMNGDAFPRESKRLGFDLMARYPRRGDRSRRYDDRYLFLEAMLSARDRLYISYVGQSIQDNTLIPPSVVVSELMDYIEQGFTTPGNAILESVLTKHRLHAFSPEYFKGNDRLFSYSEADYRAAQYLVKTREAPAPFMHKSLSEPEPEWRTVDLKELCRFFANPAKYLLNKRLGIYFEQRGPVLEDNEPFDVKALDKYLLEKRLTDRRFSGCGLKDFFPAVKASGQLPHGTVGECLYEEVCEGVERFVETSRLFMEEPKLAPLEVAIELSGFRVTGTIDAIYPKRLIQYRYAQIKPKDRLRMWIYHLALNCAQADGYPRTSMLVALTDAGQEPTWTAWEYLPVENGNALLTRLLKKYWEGMTRPLHFFPATAWEYARWLLEKKNSEEEALHRARRVWNGNEYAPGEGKDPYYQLCFAVVDSLDSAFQETATETFGPLLGSEKNVRL